MRSLTLVLILVASVPALAEPPAPLADRAKILAIEMRRGPAENLGPYLATDAHPLLRQHAIRALGRIGDRGRAPVMLTELLGKEKTQLPLALWAAGIARSEKLAEPIAKHLGSEDPLVAAAAAEALGWTGAKDAAAMVASMLHRPSAQVRTGALRGLARLRPEAMLERMIPFLDAKDPHERAAAEFAVWRTAEARGKTAREKNPDWKGVPSSLLTGVKDAPVDRRLMLLRAAAPLQHGPPPPELLDDPAPRVVQEAVRRFEFPVEALEKALHHADPLVRRTAAEALGKQGAAEPLRKRLTGEKDLRVRDVLAVELSRCGDESAWKSIASDPARIEIEEVTRLLTKAEVLLASDREDALAELCAWMSPTKDHQLPPAVLVRSLWQLGGRKHPALEAMLREVVLGFFRSGEHVLAAALGVIIENGYVTVAERKGGKSYRGLLTDTLNGFYPLSSAPQVGPEVNRAFATAVGSLAENESFPADLRKRLAGRLRFCMSKYEPSPGVRLAARESAEKLGMKDLPTLDDLPANDWKGLPRPKGDVLGVRFHGDDEWLTEEQILRLADRITETRARIEIETTAGTMTLELYPEHAPVHCASLVLSAVRGTYRNTRWHRVVPSFVIQGGDPHGHGGGDAGFTISDEIGPIRYDRGVLGMPKSRKDDGGCQIFVMHTPYPRLDELYTSYGRVVTGLDVVDRIRVGDLILDVRVLE